MPSESTDVLRCKDPPLIWVTGATSFLGRHVALTLSKQGFDVVGFSRLALEPEITREWGFTFVEHGPFAEALLRRAARRANPPIAVFHAIGSGSVAQADADPVADSERTLQTTRYLLDYLCEDAPKARVIYPSSAAVYGNTPPRPTGENALTAPISTYGKHKLRAEDIFRSYAQRNGLQIAIVRFFSVYGAPQRKLLFWDVGQRLLSGERTLTLGGTGVEARDLIHISDAARIVAALILAENPPPLLNGGTGLATSVKISLELLANALDVDANFSFDGRSRPGNPLHQQADVTALHKLGYLPSVSIEHGIAEYGAWLRSAKANNILY